MDDFRRQDKRLFVRELLRPERLVWIVPIWFLAFLLGKADWIGPLPGFVWSFLFFVCGLGAYAFAAFTESIKHRFIDKRFEGLWNGCRERMARFDEVLGKMRKEQVADLREMPDTMRRISESLYAALRRADMIAHEVMKTERDLRMAPPTWRATTTDPQSVELYQLADRNIAEYRAEFSGVMSGVQRTEAQCAVFMTTVDTLRMKMLGYRLIGKNPELRSHDFLEAMAEARLQLQSIDHALEELDLGHYPKMVATPGNVAPEAMVPPPVPSVTEEPRHLEQGQ